MARRKQLSEAVRGTSPLVISPDGVGEPCLHPPRGCAPGPMRTQTGLNSGLERNRFLLLVDFLQLLE